METASRPCRSVLVPAPSLQARSTRRTFSQSRPTCAKTENRTDVFLPRFSAPARRLCRPGQARTTRVNAASTARHPPHPRRSSRPSHSHVSKRSLFPENKSTQLKPETVNIAVDAAGLIYWNETQVTEAELDVRLETEATKQPQPEVHIRGDKAVAYEHVIKTMAAVQRAGILKLGFVTEPGN